LVSKLLWLYLRFAVIASFSPVVAQQKRRQTPNFSD
jgi:hypothetical protein